MINAGVGWWVSCVASGAYGVGVEEEGSKILGRVTTWMWEVVRVAVEAQGVGHRMCGVML